MDYATISSTVPDHWFMANLFGVVVGGKNRIYVSGTHATRLAYGWFNGDWR